MVEPDTAMEAVGMARAGLPEGCQPLVVPLDGCGPEVGFGACSLPVADRRGWEWASGSNSGPTLSELLDPEDSLECTPWRGADPDDPFNPIGPAIDCKVQGAYLNDLRAARRQF